MIIHNMTQRTPEWYKLRLGIPTGSCAGKIVTGTGKQSTQIDKYAMQLAAELVTGEANDDFTGTIYMERGINMEAEAKNDYAFVEGVEIREVGFVTNDDATMGCSPDGLIGETGMIEIKCNNGDSHVDVVRYIHKNGKPPAKYIPQVMMQMMICERHWCDLYFFHDKMRPIKCRVEPDMMFTDGLELGLENLFLLRDHYVKMIKREQIG